MEIPKYFYFRVRTINKGTGIEMEDASDVDVVEVVRCKDCIYCVDLNDDKYCHCKYWVRVSVLDGFCHNGKRREK